MGCFRWTGFTVCVLLWVFACLLLCFVLLCGWVCCCVWLVCDRDCTRFTNWKQDGFMHRVAFLPVQVRCPNRRWCTKLLQIDRHWGIVKSPFYFYFFFFFLKNFGNSASICLFMQFLLLLLIRVLGIIMFTSLSRRVVRSLSTTGSCNLSTISNKACFGAGSTAFC